MDKAVAVGLDAIAICDHNATMQTPVVRKIGAEKWRVVFYGIELTTREEAHCVAIMPYQECASLLQEWVDANIIKMDNVPEKFGDQVWGDENKDIAGEVGRYLNSPMDRSVEEIAAQVKRIGNLFVPAHVDRMANSLIGQLGFIAASLPADAVEYNFPDRLDALRRGGTATWINTLYIRPPTHISRILSEPTLRGCTPKVENSRNFAWHSPAQEGAG